jgi:hypothetical protein
MPDFYDVSVTVRIVLAYADALWRWACGEKVEWI